MTAYLVGRKNKHHDPRIRQIASTKPTLREHDTERYYGEIMVVVGMDRLEKESRTTITSCF